MRNVSISLLTSQAANLLATEENNFQTIKNSWAIFDRLLFAKMIYQK